MSNFDRSSARNRVLADRNTDYERILCHASVAKARTQNARLEIEGNKMFGVLHNVIKPLIAKSISNGIFEVNIPYKELSNDDPININGDITALGKFIKRQLEGLGYAVFFNKESLFIGWE